jgi:hypothetical protein
MAPLGAGEVSVSGAKVVAIFSLAAAMLVIVVRGILPRSITSLQV